MARQQKPVTVDLTKISSLVIDANASMLILKQELTKKFPNGKFITSKENLDKIKNIMYNVFNQMFSAFALNLGVDIPVINGILNLLYKDGIIISSDNNTVKGVCRGYLDFLQNLDNSVGNGTLKVIPTNSSININLNINTTVDDNVIDTTTVDDTDATVDDIMSLTNITIDIFNKILSYLDNTVNYIDIKSMEKFVGISIEDIEKLLAGFLNNGIVIKSNNGYITKSNNLLFFSFYHMLNF